MKFSLSDDQAALRDGVRRFLEKHSSMAQVREAVDRPGGYDADLWNRMVGELGLTAIGVPEVYGGTGANFVDLAVVMEELGRALTPSPFFSSSVLAGRLLLEVLNSNDDDATGDTTDGATGDTTGDATSADAPAALNPGREASRSWLTAMVSGEITATVALLEASGDWSFNDLTTAARPAGERWILSGEKSFVTDGSTADLLLVLARTEAGPTLFGVRRGTGGGAGDGDDDTADGHGVHSARLDGLDPTRALSTVTFSAAPATVIGAPGGALPVLDRALRAATVALACEQVGGATSCLDMAVEYAKTRIQFGRPIGSFQAIKHLLVDRLADNESARAAAYYGAWAVDHEPIELAAVASLCKAFASDAYVAAAKANIQVHGGIGFTWEHDAHFYLKRALSTKPLLGSTDAHLERIAAHVLDDDAARGARPTLGARPISDDDATEVRR